ncbi:MAG TPA: hypothetical protein VFS27_02330, partial [Blastocatellia bacterium]|nr:hypothetical protein [Blastocatellia bacterium]
MRPIMLKRFLTIGAAIFAVPTIAQPGWSQPLRQTTTDFYESDYEEQALSYLYYSLYIVGAWVFGLVTLFMLGKLYSTLTLRSIEEADPNGAAGEKETSLRSRYKRLINVAGVYYYVSLPVVIFLVLAVAGALFYGFFL